MKNFIKLLFGTAFTAAIILSCKKDENQVFFEGGTNPVLTVSSAANLFLDSTKKNTIALTFSWTNPNYKFNTGISSQNVSYILQVDTTGSNFTNPSIQETAIANNLSAAFTVKEINTFLNKLLMARDVPHNMEFRIKSTINGTVPLFSNAVSAAFMGPGCSSSFDFLSKLKPVAIHQCSNTRSCSDICGLPFGGICFSSRGFKTTRLYNSLASGFPAVITDPSFPPFNNPSRLSSRNPPFCFFSP